MLQRWLSRICDDPILATEEEVRSFIESDFGYQPTPNTRKKVSTGFSLMKRGVPDEDEELQKARFELTKLEGQFFDAAKAIDKLAKSRKCAYLDIPRRRVCSTQTLLLSSPRRRSCRDGQQTCQRGYSGSAPSIRQCTQETRTGVSQSGRPGSGPIHQRMRYHWRFIWLSGP